MLNLYTIHKTPNQDTILTDCCESHTITQIANSILDISLTCHTHNSPCKSHINTQFTVPYYHSFCQPLGLPVPYYDSLCHSHIINQITSLILSLRLSNYFFSPYQSHIIIWITSPILSLTLSLPYYHSRL